MKKQEHLTNKERKAFRAVLRKQIRAGKTEVWVNEFQYAAWNKLWRIVSAARDARMEREAKAERKAQARQAKTVQENVLPYSRISV